MKFVQFETYKKIGLIILLSIFFFASVLPLIHIVALYLVDNDIAYLIFIIIELIIGIFLFSKILLLIKNYNKVYYFKISDKEFDYLAIYKQTHTSGEAILTRLNSIYFKPQYNTKSFYNISKFKSNNSGQIVMFLTDGSKSTLPNYFSERKLSESLLALNSKIISSNKAAI